MKLSLLLLVMTLFDPTKMTRLITPPQSTSLQSLKEKRQPKPEFSAPEKSSRSMIQYNGQALHALVTPKRPLVEESLHHCKSRKSRKTNPLLTLRRAQIENTQKTNAKIRKDKSFHKCH